MGAHLMAISLGTKKMTDKEIRMTGTSATVLLVLLIVNVVLFAVVTFRRDERTLNIRFINSALNPTQEIKK